jgi:hypothetical protein
METYDGPAWRFLDFGLISTLREVASKGPLDVLINYNAGRAGLG